jgi:DNA ligase 1
MKGNIMQEVKSIFDRLQATSGKNDKKNILLEASNNTSFKYILNFLLDSNITTGISKAKISKPIEVNIILDSDIEFSKKSFIDVLEYIKINNTGTKDILWNIEYWLRNNSPNEDMTKFYKSIITKSLKIGIDVKTANEVYGRDFVFQFNVQLGTSIKDVKLTPNSKIFISRKLNGVRMIYLNEEFRSRQGKVITGLNHILNDINSLNLNNNIVLDGELIRKNIDGVSDAMNFQISSGIVNSNSEDKSELKYVIFDIITKDDFSLGISEYKYSDRKAALLSVKDKIKSLHLENIEIVEFMYEGNDHSQIDKWLQYCERPDVDYEGIMINLDTQYECKRTKNLIKAKKFYSCDIRCVRLERGKTTSTENTLGSIICNYKGYEVAVSGFKDDFADYYWHHPDEIIGRIIEVKYKEETKNKQGGLSLQFPKFICIRNDKNEESYN